MWFFVLLGIMAVAFWCLDSSVGNTIDEAQSGSVDLNDYGWLKALYLGVGGLLVLMLAFVALVCFTYPLRY